MDMPNGNPLHSGGSWADVIQDPTKMEGGKNGVTEYSPHPVSPLDDLVSKLATKVNKFVAHGHGEHAKTQGLIKMEREESGPNDDAVSTQPSDRYDVAAASVEPPLLEKGVTTTEVSPVPGNFQQLLDEITQIRMELPVSSCWRQWP